MDITPKTKVGELLDNYPFLEEILIEISPAFAVLKNPILRRTVAKVTTLQQASSIGGIKIEELVNLLRSKVGQEPLFGSFSDSAYLVKELPEWYNESMIVKKFDAREVIQSGGSPLNTIVEETGKLNSGEIYEFTTPFVPAPILDILTKKGFNTFSHEKEGAIINVVKKP